MRVHSPNTGAILCLAPTCIVASLTIRIGRNRAEIPIYPWSSRCGTMFRIAVAVVLSFAHRNPTIVKWRYNRQKWFSDQGSCNKITAVFSPAVSSGQD